MAWLGPNLARYWENIATILVGLYFTVDYLRVFAIFRVKIEVFQLKKCMYVVTLHDMDYYSNYLTFIEKIAKILYFLKKVYSLYTMCGELLWKGSTIQLQVTCWLVTTKREKVKFDFKRRCKKKKQKVLLKGK